MIHTELLHFTDVEIQHILKLDENTVYLLAFQETHKDLKITVCL